MSKTSGFKVAVLAASIALAMGSTAVMAATAPAANQLPGQGSIAVGAATSTVDTTNNVLGVTLTANTVIDWGKGGTDINKTGTAGFNIGSGATVNFTGAFGALNVDVSGNASQIFGKLNSVGDVYVANGNGIIVGATAQISGSGVVGLIGNTLINADGTAFVGTTYPAVVSYEGTGGDVSVASGAKISSTAVGGTVLISGGGMVNVDLGALKAGNASLQAGIPNSTNALVTPNSGASLTVAGTLGGATLVQLASAGDATNNAGSLDTMNLTYGAYTAGTASYADSDVAGTFTNNGQIAAIAKGLDITGAVVNNGKLDSTGKAVAAAGGITNVGTLLSGGITSGAFSNQGNLTDTAGISVVGGDFNNAGQAATTTVTVNNGAIVNSGKLKATGLTTQSDGLAKNGFAAGGNYSITNTGTVSSAGNLALTANTAQTGGKVVGVTANGSTGGIHDTGTLVLGAAGNLTLTANNNVELAGAVQTPKGTGVASTGIANPLGGLTVSAGSYNNAAYGAPGVNVFNATGGVTISPDIYTTGAVAIQGNTVTLMGNLGGDNGGTGFDVNGSPSALSVAIIAGATPATGASDPYAVRVAAGKTVGGTTITIDGDQASDTPNVILQGTLASNSIKLGSTNAVGDVFSGAAGGLVMWNTAVAPLSNTTLEVDSVGRVKAAPYLNDANFRFNGLPVTTLDGSTVNLTVSADDMQGTPTSGYNLLVNGGVNLTATWTGATPVTGTSSQVTGVTVIPNSHFVLQSTGNIATTAGTFYWPGYIYLGNISADANGNALPGTLGTGTIALGGNFSNVLPGDVAGASGIHFITQFPMNLGAFTVTTNANAWVNFGSDALTQLYSSGQGATGPFFGGTQGSGKVVNYGVLKAANFVTQVPSADK